jgi:hypothetical protein
MRAFTQSGTSDWWTIRPYGGSTAMALPTGSFIVWLTLTITSDVDAVVTAALFINQRTWKQDTQIFYVKALQSITATFSIFYETSSQYQFGVDIQTSVSANITGHMEAAVYKYN